MAKCKRVAGYQPPREPDTYILELNETEAGLLIDLYSRMIPETAAHDHLQSIGSALMRAGAKDRGPAERELMGMKEFSIGQWRPV